MSHRFWKYERCAGTVNKTSFYAEAVAQKVLKKKCYEKFRKIDKKTSVPESLFCLS